MPAALGATKTFTRTAGAGAAPEPLPSVPSGLPAVNGHVPAIAEQASPEEMEELWEALRDGDQPVIEALLVGDGENPPLGVGVEVHDECGMRPLHWLTVEGHASVAQWLLDEVKADVDGRDGVYGQTALHFACSKGKETMANLLLHRGAAPATTDHAGWIPLHAAARSGFADVMGLLLDVLPPEAVNAPGGADGESALHRAAFWGQLDAVNLLVRRAAPRLALLSFLLTADFTRPMWRAGSARRRFTAAVRRWEAAVRCRVRGRRGTVQPTRAPQGAALAAAAVRRRVSTCAARPGGYCSGERGAQ